MPMGSDSRSRRARLEVAGAWLREQRTRRGFRTGGAFARALGVDPSAVSGWETGASRVGDERAEAIAELLGLDIITVRRRLDLWVPPETVDDAEDSGWQRVDHLLAQAQALMDQLEAESADTKARQIQLIRELIGSLGGDPTSESVDRKK